MIVNVNPNERERLGNYLVTSAPLDANQLTTLRNHYLLNEGELGGMNDGQLWRYFCEPYSVESDPQTNVPRVSWNRQELQHILLHTKATNGKDLFEQLDILAGGSNGTAEQVRQFNRLIFHATSPEILVADILPYLTLMLNGNVITQAQFNVAPLIPDPTWTPTTVMAPRADDLLGLTGVALELADLEAVRG